MRPFLMANAVAAVIQYANFSTFFVIPFENTDYEIIEQDPYFMNLSARGMLLSNNHGVTHPSQPNYLAMIAGTDFGLKTDEVVDLDLTTTIVDLLEEKKLTWASYQQDYPSGQGCVTVNGTGGPLNRLYARKHNPFMTFENIRNDPKRCSRIVNADQLYTDIKNNALPDYIFYTPNQNNDMHDTNTSFGSKWLQSFLEPLLVKPELNETLFFITFDENNASYIDNDLTKPIDNRHNRIYGLLIGAGVKAGVVDNTFYNHYSQLAFLQQEWCLGSLNRNDTTSNAFSLNSNAENGSCKRQHPSHQQAGNSPTESFESNGILTFKSLSLSVLVAALLALF